MQVERFGQLKDGRPMHLFTLTNDNGMKVTITDMGASIVSIFAPDRDDNYDDIVLGFKDPADYEDNGPNFGLVAGRVANRIGRGKFRLNGRDYQVSLNEGINHLHGGMKGFGNKLWNARQDGDTLCLTLFSPDGDEGYPGNLIASVRYTLTQENDLILSYTAFSDQDTLANLTNHTYFNLNGMGDILDHEIMIAATEFTPVDDTLIPTGQLRRVEGTPFDFRKAKPIGRDIGADDEQLRLGGGYDHNFALTGTGLAARVYDPVSGRTLEVYTDLPGIQFYTGNMLDGKAVGKDGKPVGPRGGFCLETQYFPDSINHDNFVPCTLRAGDAYETVTLFKFR